MKSAVITFSLNDILHEVTMNLGLAYIRENNYLWPELKLVSRKSAYCVADSEAGIRKLEFVSLSPIYILTHSLL